MCFKSNVFVYQLSSEKQERELWDLIDSYLPVLVCGRGNYWNSTVEECRHCPVATYSDTDDADSCTQCPGEQTTSLQGSDVIEQCRKRM